MKKIITIVLVVSMVITVIPIVSKSVKSDTEFRHDLTAKLNGIKVTWSRKKNANKYELYRVKVKSTQASPGLKKYKKIKTLKKRSYIDRNIKKNSYYGYYVKAINKKSKVIGTTRSFKYEFEKKGLSAPRVSYAEFDEDNSHKTGSIMFEVQKPSEGFRSKKIKYQFVRKKSGAKKFEKIKIKKKKMTFNKTKNQIVLIDKKVLGNKKYCYKVRAYYKKGKKKYYSRFSKKVNIRSFENHAAFDIDSLTRAGEYNTNELEVTFEIKKTNKYSENAKITNNVARYCVDDIGNNIDYTEYDLNLTQFSTDNKTWKDIPNKIELPFNRIIYLKGNILSNTSKIIFGGNDKVNYSHSSIFSSSLIDSPDGLIQFDSREDNKEYTITDLDFLDRKGVTYCDIGD